jgi:hypothetical protein
MPTISCALIRKSDQSQMNKSLFEESIIVSITHAIVKAQFSIFFSIFLGQNILLTNLNKTHFFSVRFHSTQKVMNRCFQALRQIFAVSFVVF